MSGAAASATLRHAAPRPGSSAATGRPGRSAVPDGAAFREARYSGAAGSLAYKLYVPANADAAPRPVIVMLHGCTQDPDDFARGTRMNAVAEAAGALVVYPRQTAAGNPNRCWNWFSPAHQGRGAGEPALVAGLAAEVAAQFGGDADRIFAAGLSAGGALAAILGSTYPDVFAAVGVHSGLPHGAASDVASALQSMRTGRRQALGPASAARPAPMIVFHGDGDRTVHPAHGGHLAGSHGSLDGRPAVKRGRANGRPYTRTCLSDGAGVSRVEYWQVEGLGHAWSGGDPDGSYADPTGPDASREMMRFFLDTPPRGR